MKKADHLISHSEFIRRLSRSMIPDEHQAEDLSQDAWLVTLQKTTDVRASFRSWVSGVIRNLSKKMHRTEKYRKTKERKAFQGRWEKATDEKAVKMEMRRLVASALLDLKEPYRSTLMLRFYDDLPHKEIARRLDVPLETMKTRLKRGLTLMREKMDEAYHGKREKWISAFLPLAGLNMKKPSKSKGPGFYEQADTFFIPLKIITGVFIILCAAIIYWLASTDSGRNTKVPEASLNGTAKNKDNELVRESNDRDEIIRIEPSKKTSNHDLNMIDRVTWRGVLIDYTSLPIGGAEIKLKSADLDDSGEPNEHKVTCDLNGRFMLKNIKKGIYTIYLRFQFFKEFNYVTRFIRWGEIALDKPGVLKKDLLVLSNKNNVICGQLYDQSTNKALNRDSVTVSISNDKDMIRESTDGDYNNLISCIVNPEDGRFCLRCVPDGQYDLMVIGPKGYLRKYFDLVKVDGGEIVNDIEIIIPLLGKLRFMLNGFSDLEMRNLHVIFKSSAGYPIDARKIYGVKFDRRMDLDFEEGEMSVSLKMGDLGIVQKKVTIERGTVAELEVNRSEFDNQKNQKVIVLGRVLLPDGVSAGRLWMRCRFKNEHFKDKVVTLGATDQHGRFTVKNMPTGLYAFDCWFLKPEELADRCANRPIRPPNINSFPTVTFNNIKVQGDSSGQFLLELKLKKGKVIGTINDKYTGAPFDEKNNGWLIYMKSVMDRLIYCGHVGSNRSNRFEMIGAPEGEYKLEIVSSGYNEYVSDVFSVKNGETVNLGHIFLQASGALDLEVKGADGAQINDYTVACNDKMLDAAMKGAALAAYVSHDPLIIRYSGLPLGAIKIHVTAKGYREQTKFIELKMGEVLKMKIVLDKE